MIANLYRKIQQWVQQPFTQNMDAIEIFLLVGLLLVAIVVWGRILAKLQEVV